MYNSQTKCKNSKYTHNKKCEDKKYNNQRQWVYVNFKKFGITYWDLKC